MNSNASILAGAATRVQKPAIPRPECTKEYVGICFIESHPLAKSIFGFTEFITALALLVVVFTIADTRYRFRIRIAPLNLFWLSYVLTALIGVLILFTDFWFANSWWVPAFLANQTIWQTALGFIFLAIPMAWMFFAYIRPPVFSKYNYLKFGRTVYDYILSGTETELAIIANEIQRSADSLVELAEKNTGSPDDPEVGQIANDILLLIGTRKFCRHVAISSPTTAIAFFEAMNKTKKYDLPLGQFAKNVSMEAISNKASILFHEDEGYYSGYLGYVRPFTKAVYGNYRLSETLGSNFGSPLDIESKSGRAWDGEQVEVYGRLVIVTLENYLKEGCWGQQSFIFNRALHLLQRSCSDLYKLDNENESDSSEIRARLDAVMFFLREAVDLLDKYAPLKTRLRIITPSGYVNQNLYDAIANVMYEIILGASAISARTSTAWFVHYSEIWSQIFNYNEGPSWKIIRFKLRRLLFDVITRNDRYFDYQSVRALGYCLNVMGVVLGTRDEQKKYYALKKAVLNWTKKNFRRMWNHNPDVAKTVEMGTITFDDATFELIKTYNKGLSRVAPQEKLQVL